MSRRSSSKRARRQRASSMPIVAETNVTADVPVVAEQLEVPEIISEPVEDIVEEKPKAVKTRTESQELNLIPEYKAGSKASFYKAFISSKQTLIEKDKALAAQASELSIAYSTSKRLELLMEEMTEMTAQEKATLEAKIVSLEEHIASLKEGRPQMIPLFGKNRLSYESDFIERSKEHTKEWNDLVRQSKNLYKDWAPKVLKFVDSAQARYQKWSSN